MADQVLTKQKLINGDQDLSDLEEVLSGPPGKLVKTRLGREVYTLASVPQINTMTREEVTAAVAPKANDAEVYKKTEALTREETNALVAPKANQADVDSAISGMNSTLNTSLANLSTDANKFYPTLAEANAAIASIAVNQPVTIGEVANGGLWYKATAGATSLTKSPYDSLTQSKNYVDGHFPLPRTKLNDNFTHNGDLTAGTDLNVRMKEGTYLTLGALLNAPDGIGVNVLFKNENYGNRFIQTIYDIVDASKKWIRVIRFNTAGGLISAEEWETIYNLDKLPRANLADSFLYVGALTSADDLNVITVKDGTYVATSTPLNAPTGETSQAIIKVEKQGAFTVQIYQRINDSRYVWKRTIQNGQPPEAWRDLSLINLSLGRANIADSFLYAGVLTSSSDLNTTQKDGTFVATSVPLNAPVGAPAIAFVTIAKAGSMVRQTYTDVQDSNKSWSRNFQNATNGIVTAGWVADNPSTATSTKMGLVKVGQGLDVQEDGTLSVITPSQQNVFAGKKLVCFGDSITEFKNYPEQIRNILGLDEAYNVGFGGCQMSAHNDVAYKEMCMYRLADYIATGDYTGLIDAANELYTRLGDDNRAISARLAAIDFNTVDYITIFYGTNDWGNKPGSLGTVAEKTPDGSTFLGSANYVVDRLQTAYPHLKIMFLSPIYRTRLVSGDNKNTDDYTNYSGEYMYQYVEGLQAVAKKNHVLCVDMYNESGINKYTTGLYLNPYPDGLHLSDAGATLIAQKISAKMRSAF